MAGKWILRKGNRGKRSQQEVLFPDMRIGRKAQVEQISLGRLPHNVPGGLQGTSVGIAPPPTLVSRRASA